MKETKDFNDAISAFAADLMIAKKTEAKSLLVLQEQIVNQDPRLLEDIDKINKLDFLLRRGKVKIMEEDE